MKSNLYLYGIDLKLKKEIAKKAKIKNLSMKNLVELLLKKHFKIK